MTSNRKEGRHERSQDTYGDGFVRRADHATRLELGQPSPTNMIGSDTCRI